VKLRAYLYLDVLTPGDLFQGHRHVVQQLYGVAQDLRLTRQQRATFRPPHNMEQSRPIERVAVAHTVPAILSSGRPSHTEVSPEYRRTGCHWSCPRQSRDPRNKYRTPYRRRWRPALSVPASFSPT